MYTVSLLTLELIDMINMKLLPYIIQQTGNENIQTTQVLVEAAILL